MTSSKHRPRGPIPPLPWYWSDAAALMFEAGTPPDRLLHDDLGPRDGVEDFQAWCMKQALVEAAERMARLLTEAGVDPADFSHLDPNQSRRNLAAEHLGESLI